MLTEKIMKIEIVNKTDLTQPQLDYINERISNKSHKNDIGPCTCWNTYASGLYAAIDKENGFIVALIEASGPDCAVNPGWWVDSKYRNKGYGKAVVVELANFLKKRGYNGVGDIRIQTYQGEYDQFSSKLKDTFIHKFTSS